MSRLFGTDGVRGRANADLTPELAMALSAAAVAVLAQAGGPRPRVVVGRDPRASGEMLEAAVCAGLAGAGADVTVLGVVPTPAVAHLTKASGASFGVMISASHNPMPDNGIKFFAAGGRKLPDAVEDAIEAVIGADPTRAQGSDVGRILTDHSGTEQYVSHLVAATNTRLEGLKVVVDTANGAAWEAAPEALRRAGAEVIAIHHEPDGLNINDNCGSTHMESLRQSVLATGADAGIGLDGDADRCLAVDAQGNFVDGDAIMVILALAMQEAGVLHRSTLVTTVMSNLGLHRAMRKAGISVETTSVGDRYVLERLVSGEFSLGGEQSGHLVLPAHATTGDGTLTALLLLARMAQTKQPLGELASAFIAAPQVLINVKVADKTIISSPSVRAAVTEWEDKLGSEGRVLLRPSGTEPLVRVMVEATEADRAQEIATDLVSVVEKAAHGPA
ncbi:phosphoglucosamine mutase [Natronoglycomyces albus]|uniref:Phosphoglucosamine mutase n=1 Tax=Natronoglycomyces albus TaxID=2811108 RepID=A0A895XM06_9ACTN|nr:phosphoglucosamine mutase [Natronoglycomyces albus]QSB06137.1 phosphoglucosamine mutase [Natronoglycomyces albus]